MIKFKEILLSSHKLLLPTALTFIAFQIKLDKPDLSDGLFRNTVSNFFGSFNTFSLINIALFPMLYILYRFISPSINKTEKKQTIVFPALLFSLFMILGYSFEQTNSLSLVKDFNNGQLLKIILVLSGYFIFFYCSIAYLYYLLDKSTALGISPGATATLTDKPRRKLLNWYLHSLSKHPFKTTFLTLFIFYIPYVIISYPAIFQGDTRSQIIQAYKELGSPGIYYMSNNQLLSPDVFINQHHPVIHTLLIHLFLVIGTYLFQSLNIGIFLYSLFQWLVCLSAISYGIKTLIKDASVSVKYATICILYFILSPRIQNYMFLVTKDVFYGICFMLEIIFVFKLYIQNKANYKTYILLAISSIGMVIFRNEATHILVAGFIFMALLFKKMRKIMLSYSFGILLFSILFFKLLLPSLSFTPGSVREMLAVPFQQTARCVRDCKDQITPEEEATISQILEYSKLQEKYDPNNVDNVKATYNEYASREDLIAYFKIWFKMGLKHPGVYIQATMNNYYRYFYPGPTILSSNSYGWSEECMNLVNEAITPLGMSFSYPRQTETAREMYDFLIHRGYIDNIPPFNILANPAIYIWIIILNLCYGIRKQSPQIKSFLMIPCFMVLVRLLGPCNGQYCRYLYPLMITLPFIVPMTLFFLRQKVIRQTEY